MTYVLITGASGGIGQAVARLGAARGLEPICVGRSAERLAGLFPGFRQIEADAASEEGVEGVFASLEAADLVPGALVHCIGSSQVGSLERARAGDLAEALRINLHSAFLMSRRYVGLMRRRASPGSVVLFSSVVARIGVAQHELIAAAKAAIEGFALSAAASHAALGIRFNVIAPGITETPLTQKILAGDAGRAAAERQYPLGGINHADDVAEAALWLASSQSRRVTGQVVGVDGGFSRIRPLVR